MRMRDRHGRIIINRDQCIYCDDFRHCRYKIYYYGKPADCPKDEREALAEASEEKG